MAYFYLVSSLPSLSLDADPPFTTADFRFRCQGALSTRDLHELDGVLNGKAGEGKSRFARKWHGLETQLRNAVVRQRASRLGVDARSSLRDHPGFDTYVEKAVAEAMARPNPLDQEQALDRCRWYLLDQLALDEPFGLSAVLGFAVKLQLAERWSALTDAAGRRQFQDIVNRNLAKEGYLLEFDVMID